MIAATASSSRRLLLLRRAGVAAAASASAGMVPHAPLLAPAKGPAVSATTVGAPTVGGVRGLASQPARAPPFHRPPQGAPHPYPHTLLKPEHEHHPHQGTWLPTATFDEEGEGFDFDHKMSLLMEVDDRPGALHEVLRWFWKYDVNITRLESRPSKRKAEHVFDMFVDFEGARGEERVDALMRALERECNSMLVLDKREVPWFPRHAQQLDAIANRVLDAGTDLTADHPGFSDPVYRRRREELAQVARQYRHGQPIPRIDYSPEEVATWGAVFERQEELLEKFACREYLEILPMMKRYCGYARDNIPQQEDISAFLLRRTGFRLRPVAGLLSSRDFLNGLAFRVFFCTQYIRHHSRPLYTPEPDICHELLGHAPMFADRDFADFSQEIGLASLGATDEEVQRLATCYWHSVEFGLCRQKGQLKAYGAGLLSSFGELEYACAPYRPAGGTEVYPEFKPWDPSVAQHQKYPITTYQPVYFVADSLLDAKERMRQYCETLKRPFYARYMPMTQSVWVDRAVKVTKAHQQKPQGNGNKAEPGKP